MMSDAEITVWEDTQQLRKMAQLLKTVLPNGARLSDGEALALAQAARALGRNPLAGEIYAIPGKGVADGYRGLMKDARPGSYHLRYRPLTAEEVAEHGVRPEDHAKACELYMFHEMEQCRRFGVPYTPTVGIGIVREAEKFQTEVWDEHLRRRVPLPREQWKSIDPPVGRSWAWKAEIRSMKDALRRAGAAYVDPEEVDALRSAAEAQGIDTRGAENAPQIAALIEQQAYLAEQAATRQEQLARVAEEFGEEVSAVAAQAMAAEALTDLFGPEETSPPAFWQIPPVWVDRLLEAVNRETAGHYRHAKHMENALRKEGVTSVTRANASAAKQILVARVRGEEAAAAALTDAAALTEADAAALTDAALTEP